MEDLQALCGQKRCVKMVRRQKRVLAKEKEVDNSKYAFRFFESLYSQFSGTYALVAASTDIAAIIRNVLDAKQMAECFSIEDFHHKEK